MARKQKLKVFRTPIGFHDAYVAAPSQKAALEAWGADSNLFVAGIAEQVDDPALMEEPLAKPGEVVRRLRGSEDEHVAALGRRAAPKGKKKEAGSVTGTPRVQSGGLDRPVAKSGMTRKEKPPKPSRAEVDAAEEALEEAGRKQREEIREVEREIAALDRRMRDLQRRHERERDKLAEERDRARKAYERAVRRWEGRA